jgi:hypothetical protein
MYFKGKGVRKDYKQAVVWFRKAAEQGDASSQNVLGLLYYKGENVPQNFKEAIKWFRKAADQGVHQSQFIIGVMYSKGQGVPNNNIVAYAICSQVAEHMPDAANLGKTLAQNMSKKEVEKAVKLSAELANPGNFQAALDAYLLNNPVKAAGGKNKKMN